MDSPFFFESTRYWSQGDEKAHFDWMQSIPCVRDVRGRGNRVYLAVDPEVVTETGLRELQAVYRRYGADLAQLDAIKPLPDELNDAED